MLKAPEIKISFFYEKVVRLKANAYTQQYELAVHNNFLILISYLIYFQSFRANATQ